MTVGIIGAVAQEVELLFEDLASSGSPVRKVTLGSLEFHEGILDGCPVVIVCGGVGKVNAALCAQMLVSVFSVDAIVNSGSAGGLDPRLRVLDMVVSTDAVHHDMDATWFGYKPGQVPATPSPFLPPTGVCAIRQGLRSHGSPGLCRLRESRLQRCPP